MERIGLFLLLAAASGLSIAMLFVGMQVYFGAFLEGVEQAADEHPGRSFLTGLVNAIFLILVGYLLVTWAQSTGFSLLGAIGFIFWFVLALGVMFGLAGMVLLARTRIYGQSAGWRPVANSGGILFLACLAPYVGWFGFLPYLILRGVGAVMIHSLKAYRTRHEAGE
jgi:hypothetical protein